MRFFLIIILYSNYSFSQGDLKLKHKINIGINIQPEFYSYKDFVYNSPSPGGYQINVTKPAMLVEFETSFQTKLFLMGLNLGYGFNPIEDGFVFKPQIKIAYNFLKKDESLSSFVGPVVKIGTFHSSPSALDDYNFSYKLNESVGFFYANKNFQLEVGALFRKKYDNVYLRIFNSCFYTSIGFRIPLKKEPKN